MAGRPETHDRHCRRTVEAIIRGTMPRSRPGIRRWLLGLQNGTAMRASLAALREWGILDETDSDDLYQDLKRRGWYVESLADGRTTCGRAMTRTFDQERTSDPTIPAWWLDRDR